MEKNIKIETAHDAKLLANSFNLFDEAYDHIIKTVGIAPSKGNLETNIVKYFNVTRLEDLNKELIEKLSSVGFKCEHLCDQYLNYYLKVSWK